MTLALLNLKVREAKMLLVEIEWSAANGQYAAIRRDALRISELAAEIMGDAIMQQRRLDVKVSPLIPDVALSYVEGASMLGNLITRKP
jgi:hypothetical protein